jgi:hypothetical protein
VGLPTDWGFTLPDEVWAIPEPERQEHAQYNNDLCKFGERRFIRCVLEIPFTDSEGYFGWGAWAEVEQSVFERYLELYDEDGWGEPQQDGRLANELPCYDGGTFGRRLLVQFRDPTKRPSLHLSTDDESTLAVEQRQGIGSGRYHEIIDVISEAD